MRGLVGGEPPVFGTRRDKRSVRQTAVTGAASPAGKHNARHRPLLPSPLNGSCTGLRAKTCDERAVATVRALQYLCVPCSPAAASTGRSERCSQGRPGCCQRLQGGWVDAWGARWEVASAGAVVWACVWLLCGCVRRVGASWWQGTGRRGGEEGQRVDQVRSGPARPEAWVTRSASPHQARQRPHGGGAALRRRPGTRPPSLSRAVAAALEPSPADLHKCR